MAKTRAAANGGQLPSDAAEPAPIEAAPAVVTAVLLVNRGERRLGDLVRGASAQGLIDEGVARLATRLDLAIAGHNVFDL